MIEFHNCKLCITLIAQSPMIHFQADSYGATLRGSELKPKLDRFLNNKIKELSNKGEIDKKELSYIDKEKGALKYKVTIQEKGQGSEYNLFENRKAFGIIYGNRNKTLLLRNCELTILCMNPILQKLIEDYLVEFFAVTNFGYMQNKGFGSFMPLEYLQEKKNIEKDVSKWLKNKCGAKACYYMDFPNMVKKDVVSYEVYFRAIKDSYDYLKTGRNSNGYSKAYIYQYMHMKGIDNEKAWMKANGIAPALKKTQGGRIRDYRENQNKKENARYVKALLGIAPKVEYLNACENNYSEKVLVKIKEESKNIERMDSPIFFKIIENYVFICAERIPDEIYGKKFVFSGNVKHPRDPRKQSNFLAIEEGREKRKSLMVPTKRELEAVGFTIDELLEKYVGYYNDNKKGKTIKKC